jgi:hypothetical protein
MSHGTDASEVLDELERSLDNEEDRPGRGALPAAGPEALHPGKAP